MLLLSFPTANSSQLLHPFSQVNPFVAHVVPCTIGESHGGLATWLMGSWSLEAHGPYPMMAAFGSNVAR